MKIKVFAILSAILALSSTASAQSTGACVYASQAAVAARFSGLEISALAAGSGGKGIWVTSLVIPVGAAARITSAAVLDADLATITKSMVYGPGVSTTVVRKGTAPAGITDGDYSTGASVQTAAMNTPGFYLPAGKFLTILHGTANFTTAPAVCFSEAQ